MGGLTSGVMVASSGRREEAMVAGSEILGTNDGVGRHPPTAAAAR
jgi:hypothetical protein